MALNTFKCNCLTPPHFKGLKHFWQQTCAKFSFRSAENGTVVQTKSVVGFQFHETKKCERANETHTCYSWMAVSNTVCHKFTADFCCPVADWCTVMLAYFPDVAVMCCDDGHVWFCVVSVRAVHIFAAYTQGIATDKAVE